MLSRSPADEAVESFFNRKSVKVDREVLFNLHWFFRWFLCKWKDQVFFCQLPNFNRSSAVTMSFFSRWTSDDAFYEDVTRHKIFRCSRRNCVRLWSKMDSLDPTAIATGQLLSSRRTWVQRNPGRASKYEFRDWIGHQSHSRKPPVSWPFVAQTMTQTGCKTPCRLGYKSCFATNRCHKLWGFCQSQLHQLPRLPSGIRWRFSNHMQSQRFSQGQKLVQGSAFRQQKMSTNSATDGEIDFVITCGLFKQVTGSSTMERSMICVTTLPLCKMVTRKPSKLRQRLIDGNESVIWHYFRWYLRSVCFLHLALHFCMIPTDGALNYWVIKLKCPRVTQQQRRPHPFCAISRLFALLWLRHGWSLVLGAQDNHGCDKAGDVMWHDWHGTEIWFCRSAQSGNQIYVTGHSMGGGVGSIILAGLTDAGHWKDFHCHPFHVVP